MGSWGTGLYSGDFAMDLRSAVGAVARLPLDPAKLVDILCEFEPAAAGNPSDEDCTTFWLVLADQFARRGIDAARARETALQIIDGGIDLTIQQHRGQSPAGLTRRGRMLADLRERIAHPKPGAKPRAVLSKPEPFVMDVGDALVYPICGRKALNPYVARQEKQIAYSNRGRVPWTQDGWGATVIVERGRAFGYFAWYRPLVIRQPLATKPDLATLAQEQWHLTLAGNCPPIQFRRMGLEKIGAFQVHPDAFRALFPGLRPGDRQAIGDISIGNRLNIVNPEREAPRRPPYDRIIRIDALTSS
jgi:hypothetical protein